jgi:transposase InsO family protein
MTIRRSCAHKFQVSMCGKGSCYEFKLIRASGQGRDTRGCRDLRQDHQGRVELALHPGNPSSGRTAIFQYINGFYYPRRHSALGWKSPVAFERTAA